MNKKLLFRYILLFLPFGLGCILFSFSVINLFSSLLFFVGGYVGIKNIFDYRMIRKNIQKVNDKALRKEKDNNYVININNVPRIRRIKIYKRVKTKK